MPGAPSTGLLRIHGPDVRGDFGRLLLQQVLGIIVALGGDYGIGLLYSVL